MSKEAMKLALEALSNITNYEGLADARKVLREALAKQEGQSNFCPQCEALAGELKAIKQEQGEPVAGYFYTNDNGCYIECDPKHQGEEGVVPLYTKPQQHKPLMQPIIKDAHGVLRFKKNGLVDALYEHGVKTGLGLNELHCMDFTVEDRQQFAQLIGYSVEGYGSLSYVTDEAYDAAAEAAHGIKE